MLFCIYVHCCFISNISLNNVTNWLDKRPLVFPQSQCSVLFHFGGCHFTLRTWDIWSFSDLADKLWFLVDKIQVHLSFDWTVTLFLLLCSAPPNHTPVLISLICSSLSLHWTSLSAILLNHPCSFAFTLFCLSVALLPEPFLVCLTYVFDFLFVCWILDSCLLLLSLLACIGLQPVSLYHKSFVSICFFNCDNKFVWTPPALTHKFAFGSFPIYSCLHNVW